MPGLTNISRIFTTQLPPYQPRVGKPWILSSFPRIVIPMGWGFARIWRIISLKWGWRDSIGSPPTTLPINRELIFSTGVPATGCGTGSSKAYGIELSFRKPKGTFNGWFNYTWSRSLLRSYNEKLADRVSNNQWYPSDFDRPHVFNGTINFEGDKYNSWSFNFTAQTGRPYTVPSCIFKLEEVEVPIYIERNNAMLRPYYRLDFSWKVAYRKRKTGAGWVIGHLPFTMYIPGGTPLTLIMRSGRAPKIPGYS